MAKCELLDDGKARVMKAGTTGVIRVRARDRFGNDTYNVKSSGVEFAIELRREPGDRFAVTPELQAATRSIGKLESTEGAWLPNGIFELRFTPASRGVFRAYVLCARSVGGSEAVATGGEQSRAPTGSRSPTPQPMARAASTPSRSGTPAAVRARSVAAEAPSVVYSEVPTFFTIPIEVEPLRPDSATSTIVNAERCAQHLEDTRASK